jgi:hypothetical protein
MGYQSGWSPRGEGKSSSNKEEKGKMEKPKENHAGVNSQQ